MRIGDGESVVEVVENLIGRNFNEFLGNLKKIITYLIGLVQFGQQKIDYLKYIVA